MPIQGEIKTNSVSKAFAREWVNNGFNGTKAYQAIRPVTSGSAEVLATRELGKVSTQKAIAEIMEAQGLNDDVVTKEHKKVVIQDENFPAKNTAIELYHKLQGRLKSEVQHNHIHLHADINEIEAKIKAVNDELAELENS